MIPPDYLGERSLYLVQDVIVRRGVLCQGNGAFKELKGDISNGRPFPQLLQLPNELRGEDTGSPHGNPTGAVIRLIRGLLAEVVLVISFRGETGKGGIEFRPQDTKE